MFIELRKPRLCINSFKYYIGPERVKEVPAPLASPQVSLLYQPAAQSGEASV